MNALAYIYDRPHRSRARLAPGAGGILRLDGLADTVSLVNNRHTGTVETGRLQRTGLLVDTEAAVVSSSK